MKRSLIVGNENERRQGRKEYNIKKISTRILNIAEKFRTEVS